MGLRPWEDRASQKRLPSRKRPVSGSRSDIVIHSSRSYNISMAIRYAQSIPVKSPEAKPQKQKHAGGRPKSENPRQLLTLRLKPETIAKFKTAGKGWQTRMSDILDREAS